VHRPRYGDDIEVCKWNKGIFGKSRWQDERAAAPSHVISVASSLFRLKSESLKKKNRKRNEKRKTKRQKGAGGGGKTKNKIKQKQKKKGNTGGESDCARIYVPVDPA